jgi:hypothetical protein
MSDNRTNETYRRTIRQMGTHLLPPRILDPDVMAKEFGKNGGFKSFDTGGISDWKRF